MAANKNLEIHFRCSEEEKARIQARADKLGLKVSQLLIWSALYPERIIAFQEGKLKHE